MRAFLLSLAMLLPVVATAQDSPLLGSWTATDAVRDGAPAPDLVGHRLTFGDDSFRIVGADGALIYGGGYRTDSAADPPTIDFVNTDGVAAGVTWSGIWRRDGAALVIVDNAPDPDRPRPARFEAPASSGYVMVTFAPGE